MKVWKSLGICVLLTLCLPVTGQARCSIKVKNPANNTKDKSIAPIRFGRVNLASTYLQPPGTLLAQAVVPPTHFTQGGATGDTVMWECDQKDIDKGDVYFLVSTNADDRIGGRHETGVEDGLPGVYATVFEYVGIKLTMAGTVLGRRWQPVPLTTYAVDPVKGKVRIRLKDVPVMEAQLYRISKLPPREGGDLCNTQSKGMAKASHQGTPHPECGIRPQPNGYIQLVGPDIKHDEIGEDHAYHYKFWAAGNGFGYGMWGSGTTLGIGSGADGQGGFCAVRSDDMTIHF